MAGSSTSVTPSRLNQRLTSAVSTPCSSSGGGIMTPRRPTSTATAEIRNDDGSDANRTGDTER